MRRELRQITQATARKLLYSGSEETWQEALARADTELRCAAKCKATQQRCRARPVLGKNVCRVHGGLSLPRTEAQKERQREVMKTQPRDARGWWVKMEPVD